MLVNITLKDVESFLAYVEKGDARVVPRTAPTPQKADVEEAYRLGMFQGMRTVLTWIIEKECPQQKPLSR